MFFFVFLNSDRSILLITMSISVSQCLNPSQKSGIIILILLIGLPIVSGLGTYFYMTYEPSSQSYQFTPTIDGNFSPDEHWDLVENIHTLFLHVDEEHTDAYNYIYANRTTEYLYILIDLCSDTTDDADEGEWINIYIDSDNSQYILPYDPEFMADDLFNQIGINSYSRISQYVYYLDSGNEIIAYDTTNDIHTTLGEIESTADYTVAYNFSTSPNSDIPHRIYEFKIECDDLSGFDGEITDKFGIMIQGYGTMAPPSSDLYEPLPFYNIPGTMGSYDAHVLGWMLCSEIDDAEYGSVEHQIYTMYLLAALEQYYFPCGTTPVESLIPTSTTTIL